MHESWKPATGTRMHRSRQLMEENKLACLHEGGWQQALLVMWETLDVVNMAATGIAVRQLLRWILVKMQPMSSCFMP